MLWGETVKALMDFKGKLITKVFVLSPSTVNEEHV